MARINKERNPFGTAGILIKRASEPAGENGSIATAQSIEKLSPCDGRSRRDAMTIVRRVRSRNGILDGRYSNRRDVPNARRIRSSKEGEEWGDLHKKNRSSITPDLANRQTVHTLEH